MIVIDTTGLLLLLDPNAFCPIDPNTKTPITDASKRMAIWAADAHRRGEIVLIPTPVLAEMLMLVGSDGPMYQQKLAGFAAFEIAPFDTRAAIEHAIITAAAIQSGDKRAGSVESMAKIKFDRQIVAIAKARGARAIFANDHNLIAFAKQAGLIPISIWQLPAATSPERVSTSIIDLINKQREEEGDAGV